MNVTHVETFQDVAKHNQTHLTQQPFIHAEAKSKRKNSRMITERKNGYIRQYLIQDDGTRVLISEMPDDISSESANEQPKSPRQASSQEMLEILNLSAGNHPIQFRPNKT